MADYDLRCLSCEHGPHMSGPCNGGSTLIGGQACPCPQFLRADLQSARALTNINNFLFGSLQRIEMALADIHDIYVEANPAATKAVNDRRAELTEQLKKEREDAEATAAEGTTGGDEAPDPTEDNEGDSVSNEPSSGAGSHPVFPRIATDAGAED